MAVIFCASSAMAGGAKRHRKSAGNSTAKGTTKGKRSKGKRSKGSSGHQATKSSEVASPGAVRAQTPDELVYSNPIRYHNLSLVMVGTKRKGPFQRYTLLEQGLAAGSLEVRELKGNSNEAQVNAVEVRNRGNYPVYLLGGEMILGGKQDRIISQDTVLENNRRWTRVSVFCVERGRWRGQNMKFRSGGAVAHLSLRRAAMSGSQGKVWADVAKKNLQQGTQSRTETYRRTIQNAAVRRKIAPYRRRLLAMMPPSMKIAGVIFAINGAVRVADLFGNPVLFASLRNKLLSSYVLEALGNQVRRNAPPVSKAAAKRWLQKARKMKRGKGKRSGRAVNYKMEDKNAVGAETVDHKTGKKVRESFIAK